MGRGLPGRALRRRRPGWSPAQARRSPPAERLYSRWDFLPVLQAGVAVVQPDPSHACGISEVRRIAALAETFDAALAPHCPLALAACPQVDFATPNLLIQEQSPDIHYNERRPGFRGRRGLPLL